LPGHFFCRIVAGRGLAGLARAGGLERHRGFRGQGPGARVCAVVCADFRPRRSGLRGRRDGACEHGPGRRSLSSRETCAAAGNRGRGRYVRLGPRTLVRRDHGAVHDLALSVLDQPADHRGDVRGDLVGAGRLAAGGRERAASTGLESRSSVSLWFCSTLAWAPRKSPRTSRRTRRSIRSIGWSARWSSS
jgi:hypothetical protein